MLCGAAHFKSIRNQYKQSSYDLYKALKEFVDNIITKCDKINIKLDIHDNKLYQITISDNYICGFKDINEEYENNPFNMGHIRSRSK